MMLDSTKTLIVRVLNHDKSIEIHQILFNKPTNVLTLLNASKMSINQSCGGNGTCTTCKFIIHKNFEAFTLRTELEVERATERDFDVSERLSCQTEIKDSAEIIIPGSMI